jgi:hydroxyethylthiazole kinase-like sugar kinase family protein
MAKTNKLHGRFRSTVLDALLKLKEERKEKSAHRRSVDVARATHPLMAA